MVININNLEEIKITCEAISDFHIKISFIDLPARNFSQKDMRSDNKYSTNAYFTFLAENMAYNDTFQSYCHFYNVELSYHKYVPIIFHLSNFFKF